MEAAKQLGLKEGTVSSRLARARTKLKQRLARRGVVLSATLCAVELSRTAAMAGLQRVALDRTIQGALSFAKGVVTADLIAPQVAALAKGVLQSMVVSTFKVAISGGLLIICLAGASLLTCQAFFGKSEEKQQPIARVAQQRAADRTALVDKEDTVRDPGKDGEMVTFSGSVLDPEGNPLGSKVYVCTNPLDKRLNRIARTKTGPDGRFRLTMSRAVYEWGVAYQSGVALVASSPGFGPDWIDVRSLDPKNELILYLAKDDVPITGRVLDLEGRPVSGARVEALRCEASVDGKLDAWLELLNKRLKPGPIPPAGSRPNPLTPKTLAAEGLDTPVAATTDAKGAFRLDGFGRERVVHLNISGPRIQQQTASVVTRPGPAPASAVAFHHATFDHFAGPSKPVAGIVREKGTGKPLAGVRVELMAPGGAVATTDKEGRYRLDGVGKAKQYGFLASGDEHFHIYKQNIADTQELDPLTVDFELEKGLMFQGRLTDRASGKPVRAYVYYFALAKNSHAKDYASLNSGDIWGASVEADGSFRLLAIPGPGLLCAVAADRDRYIRSDLKDWDGLPIQVMSPVPVRPTSYHAVLRVEPSEMDPKSVWADIQFEVGKIVTGQIERPDGKPLPGAMAAGLSPVTDLNFHVFGRSPLKTAEFIATGLPPGRPGALVFFHAEEKLGKVQPLKDDETGPLTVRLEPLGTLTGRVLGPEGRPMVNVQVVVSLSTRLADYKGIPLELFVGGRGSLRERNRSTATTDTKGAFRIQGLIPGLKYELLIRQGEKNLSKVRDVSARTDQVLDLGVLRIHETPSDEGRE
jgi:protocatechuate 3,4-dioxygenase beta subunit